MIDFIQKTIDFILHIDKHLVDIINHYGNVTYVILFLVVFCETGLVITPFLPGDSLFFAAGALCAKSDLNIYLTLLVCFLGAILGNTVNYSIGKRIGPTIFNSKSKLIKKEYLDKTHAFYEKHGAKAIILSRFLPIFRTFVPFIAGVAKMDARQHLIYNVIGAALWVSIFVLLGYFFGMTEVVQNNFSAFIILIIVVTLLPGLLAFIKNQFFKKKVS
ncbi:MAG TPA: DedA family protein [Saprospiraceae bacterium]|nr:DedA family protein [Saprospiraceae bacterium]HQW56147.1 DedA family protein [Saprospiraceae bacterium]